MIKFIGKATGISLLLVLVLMVGGCANKDVNPHLDPAARQASDNAIAKEKAVMDTFNVLLQKKGVMRRL